MKRLSIVGLGLCAATLAAPALPQEDDQTYDRVDLMAEARLDVENDVLIAMVFAEVENNDQADAAAAVNEAIAWAADRARRVEGVEIQTTNYTTRPLYANGRRIVGWAARQGLRLESGDAGALSALLGELQERVAVQSMSYGLSDAARNGAEERLIADSLAQFDRRARLVAGELGRDGFRIVQLSIGTGGFFLPREAMALSRAADASFTPPEIEAGTQSLTVTVNGTIELDAAP
ncbi:MAG TPA: SIMPL domain-containing protein [Gammaproteobacteria bacterium]|nr:SIMPL domain-containing protein [Gammaproteobacteria bacterium]